MGSSTSNGTARAVADLADLRILASVEVGVPPERAFRALASKEITEWWVRPGVFDTREWDGDLRVGGRWRASGVGRGEPYVMEGEYLEIDAPRKLVHTCNARDAASTPSKVTYLLEPVDSGTRITLRQSGFASREMCEAFAAGWETSFDRLTEILDREAGSI